MTQKRTTTRHRLQQVIREYKRRHPGPFPIESVATWALSQGLLPVPGRPTSSAEAVEEWDGRFERIASEVLGEETA